MDDRFYPIDLFNRCKLTYKDITELDIHVLIGLIAMQIKSHRELMSVNTMTISKDLEIETDEDGCLKKCCIKLDSHYFSGRDGIRFDSDGRIYIAPWADYSNYLPLANAFEDWVQLLSY